MKIKKIENMLDIEEQFDVELQACHNDCKEYFNKTRAGYSFLKRAGCKVDGNATVAEIREILNVFGFYCYRLLTPKTSIYL